MSTDTRETPIRDGVKRKSGPFKRSRTGCGTCKSRGKKCDESWDEAGHCERCRTGGWRCSGENQSGERRTPRRTPTTPSVAGGSSVPPQASGTGLDIANFFSSSFPTVQASDPPIPFFPMNEAPFAPAFGPQGSNVPSSTPTTLDSSLPFPWDNASTTDWDNWDAFFVDVGGSVGNESTTNTGPMVEQILQIPNTKPARQGVSLAEIYARVVESWLVGLPSAQREYARTRIMSLNDSNSVMRKVRFAVSVAYIILFSAGPQGVQDPQIKLVELAYKGAGLPQPSPTNPPEAGQATTEHPAASPSNARYRLRLYADNVSRAFAADEESKRWTDEAIRDIRDVMVHDKGQLSDMLWGVIDLQLVEFIRGGAAPSYNMLALGDRLVRSVWQENHPTIRLDELRSPETFSLRLYALSDISRCIVNRGRRTLFNFATSTNVSSDGEEPWSAYLGLPDAIVLLLVDVVNLCADSAMEAPVHVRSRAEDIEAALRAWTQPVLSSTGLDPTALISRTIAGELWRLSGLILLYQSVHKVGGLHPVLRQSRDEMLALLDSLVQLPNGDLWGFIALPSFLASGLSLDKARRDRGLKHMRRTGPERVWLDNIALVEAVWEEVDRTGRLPDWHDKMTREGLSVAFF